MTEEAATVPTFTQYQREQAYKKQWALNNITHVRQVRRDYYLNNKEILSRKQAAYRETRREYLRVYARKACKEIRENIFTVLGHACIKCGFTDKRALQFDHIKYIGRKNRKHGTEFYCHYRKYPELIKKDLQVLCANCNWIKKVELGEN